MPRPLVLTADTALLDDLLRLAAAAGAEPDVFDHAAAAAPFWKDAPLAVVGADQAGDAVAAGLPRRPGLVVAGTPSDQPDVWRHAVNLGAEHVVFLPEAEPWLLDRLADAVADPAARGRVTAVIGARGGAGATSFSVALALASARAGKRTLLVDADPFGGGIDLALGAEDVAGPRWDAFAESPHPVGGEALASSLPRCGEVTVLAWPRGASPVIPAARVESMLVAARRAAQLVVVDVARSFDEASRVALSVADVAFVVCPAEVRACASGRRVADTVRLFVDDVRVVARGPAPTDLDGEVVAEALGLPLAGWLKEEPGIDVALDEGRPPGRGGRGPLAELCGRLVPELLA
ncbi:MAG TPA: septum site-determining protein Ssd [Frankiaceae bacterium]|nr:septum site-determining protein Ssd [Frankiaceae bacterium]